MKSVPQSLRILLVHGGLVVVSFLLYLTPLAHKPGAMHPLLLLPSVYLVFSAIPFGWVIIRGIVELGRKESVVGSRVAIWVSLICLVLVIWGASRLLERAVSV